MRKLEVTVSGADIKVKELGKLTSGMVGAKVLFSFSSEWDGLLKIAVFKGNDVLRGVPLTTEEVKIPTECLAEKGTLWVGAYGFTNDGTVAIPTVRSDDIVIHSGAAPSGETAVDPTPPLWAQLMTMMGDPIHLTTEDRSTLVAAINEIAGYKGMELDDDQINAVIEYYFEKHPPTIGEMAMTGDLDMDSHRVKNVAAPEADADAVNLGYLNKNCAPAGYGLGGDYATVISDANLAITTGKYATDDATLNLPVSGLFGVLDVASHRTDKMITQKFYPGTAGYQGCVLVRVAINGTWEEWEWENPPMVPGVVYRTTERWNGKVVYTQLFNCGDMPNCATKSIAHGIAITKVVRCVGQDIASGSSLPRIENETNIYIYAGTTHITLTTTYNFSGRDAYAQIWYIKD